MKTKQEQIEEMQKTICDNCKDKYSKKGHICPWQDKDTKVVSSKVYDLIDNTKEIANARETWEKQAKIDVLNELTVKAVSLSAIETYHICNLVDELIEEIVK